MFRRNRPGQRQRKRQPTNRRSAFRRWALEQLSTLFIKKKPPQLWWFPRPWVAQMHAPGRAGGHAAQPPTPQGPPKGQIWARKRPWTLWGGRQGTFGQSWARFFCSVPCPLWPQKPRPARLGPKPTPDGNSAGQPARRHAGDGCLPANFTVEILVPAIVFFILRQDSNSLWLLICEV